MAFQHRLSHTGTVTLWPADNLADDVTYRVELSGIQDYMGNTMTPYQFSFSTGNAPVDPTPTPTDTPTATPDTGPTPTPTDISAPTSTPTNTATNTPVPTPTDLPTSTPTTEPPPTGWIHCADENDTCTVPVTTVVRYGANGSYAYQENVSGSIGCNNGVFGDPAFGTAKMCEYWSGVPAPDYAGSPYYPNQSSQISCRAESAPDNVWVVNPDNHSITIVDTFLEPGSRYVALNTQREVFVNYRTPTSITRSGAHSGAHSGDHVAVTYRDDDKVVFHDSATARPVFAIDTGHGTQPVASVTDGSRLFVALIGSGEVIAIDLSSRAITNRLDVGPVPKAMAMVGQRLLVTRFISPSTHGEVYDIDTSSGLTLTRTITVNKVLVNDGLDHGSGIPNFLSSIVINRDGTEAYITAAKANIDRGTSAVRSGTALDDDNTIRPMLVILDLINHRDANVVPLSPDGTVDFDNAADPAGVTYLVDGESRVVTFQGNNVVHARNDRLNTNTQFSSGFAPQEMCATLRTLYVKDFTGRTVSAIDVAAYLHDGQRNPHILTINTVGDELLAADELAGLRHFYHASIPEMGPEGYMSCASCHADGGQDGQVWDMTSFGEGLRNTISLNGTSGTRFGNLHWSANFDEVQDFEVQIEGLNRGNGLIPGQTFHGESPLDVVTGGQSAELDALAAYVSSLGRVSVKRSPYRTYTGQLTAAAQRGQQVFAEQGLRQLSCGSSLPRRADARRRNNLGYVGQSVGRCVDGHPHADAGRTVGDGAVLP